MTGCLKIALEANGPVYLRMGKADLGDVHSAAARFGPGNLVALREGDGALAWIATGSMVHTALRLAEHWLASAVYSAPCLKPLDSATVAAICRDHRAIVTLEEHSVNGGLGSAVCEIAATHAPAWICRIGVPDRFSRMCGSYTYLLSEHRLDDSSVLAQVAQFLAALPGNEAIRRSQKIESFAA
jgi:transketolase